MQAMKFTASLLKILLCVPFRICVCLWKMLSNMSMKGPLKRLFWKAYLAWLSQGGVRVLRWWYKWQSSVALVLDTQLWPMCERNTSKWRRRRIFLVWGPYALAFPPASWYLLKIIKYVPKTSDIWIHKSTVIVNFWEGNYWFKMTAMSLLEYFIELFLSDVKFLFSSTSQIVRA